MTRIAAAGLALAAVLAAAPALAAEQGGSGDEKAGPPPLFSPLPKGDDDINAPQLHFTAVEAGKRNVLFAWGHIDSGDSERFRTAIQKAKPIEEVWLFSGGGALEEGLQIGRIIRAEKLTTHIRRGMQCISACNFMFMGGVVRSIDPGGVFGVHMFTNESLPLLIVADLLHAQAKGEAAYRLAHSTEAPPRSPHRLIPPRLPDLTGGVHPQREPPKQAPAEAAPAPDDHLLDISELGCPEQAVLQPAGLDQRISDVMKAEGDPARRAELSPMLKRMTLYVLCIEQVDARQAAEIARFLVDMSLSLRFLTEFANIPNAHYRALTRDELRDFNIVNTE